MKLKKGVGQTIMKKNTDQNASSRLGRVGGQAVLEGVMMKCGENVSLTVRCEDGNVISQNQTFKSIRKKGTILNVFVIRGFINFIDMLKLSFKTLSDSVDLLGLNEEEQETKFEKWLHNKFGKSLMDIVMVIGTVLGVAIGVGLFVFLPEYLANIVNKIIGNNSRVLMSLVAGVVRIAIFVLYMWLVSLMKEIRRTFEYHGAEHKSIACYENGIKLTPENAALCSRFHPRCGTSFIFVIMIVSIVIFAFVPINFDNVPEKINLLLRVGIRLLLLPLVMGIGYEFIMLAGKSDNILVKIISYPGILMQHITTREPDLNQLEIAIISLKAAMPEEFPDFDAKIYGKKEKEKSLTEDETTET